LISADGINLLDENTSITKKNTKAPFVASQETGLDRRTQRKPKGMFMSAHQNALQNHKIEVANEFFENLAKFK
jgi:hypothetical protein